MAGRASREGLPIRDKCPHFQSYSDRDRPFEFRNLLPQARSHRDEICGSNRTSSSFITVAPEVKQVGPPNPAFQKVLVGCSSEENPVIPVADRKRRHSFPRCRTRRREQRLEKFPKRLGSGYAFGVCHAVNRANHFLRQSHGYSWVTPRCRTARTFAAYRFRIDHNLVYKKRRPGASAESWQVTIVVT